MGGSDAGRVFPQVSKIRDVSLNVAVAIGKVAVEAGMSKTYGVRPLPLVRTLVCRVTSLIRNTPPRGPYRRPMPRVLGGS